MKVGTKWRAALLGFLAVMSGFGIVAPSTATAETAGPTAVGVGSSVVSGQFHTCVIDSAQKVECWGRNHEGQIGSLGGGAPNFFSNSPVISFNNTANSVASSFSHTCAIKATDGTVWCWGKNDLGQSGATPSIAEPTPVQVTPLGSGIVSISAGERFTCAVKCDGTVFCWGANGLGQLGNSTVTAVPQSGAFTHVPVQVTGLTSAIAVDAGDNFACALKSDGTVSCWGDNAVGQLGRGTNGGFEFTAAAIPGLDRVAGLASGFAHACARKTSGALLCWGSGDAGQLGLGDTSPQYSPQIVPGLGSVSSVAAASYTTCAVTSVGAARCWGSNSDGQIGNGTTTNATSPSAVALPAGTAAAVIAPGYTHTCALLTDQRVACWGANNYGQLGNGQPFNSADSTVPVIVPGLNGVPLTSTPTPGGVTPNPVVTDQPFSALAAPERLLDTRSTGSVIDGNAEYQRTGAIGSVPKSVKIAGRGTTPSGMASAVLNVTVANAGQAGFVTVWPCDQSRPNASSLNYKAGDTVANAVMTKLDSSGGVCLFAETPVDILIDAAGYFPTTSSFTPLAAPQRVLETRPGAIPTVDGLSSNEGRLLGGGTYTLKVAGRAGVPNGTASVALNVTAINGGSDGGYLTAFPCDAGRPNASNVNIAETQTIPNLVVSKLSADGKVCLFSFKDVDLAVDVVGYFATTVSYTPLSAPIRFMDTRAGGATPDGVASGPTALTLDGTNPYELLVGGRNGISPTAGSVLMNVTVAEALGAGYVTVYPCGQARPDSSNINYKSGQTIANSVAAGIGTGRKVCIYSSSPTSILVDVAGTLS